MLASSLMEGGRKENHVFPPGSWDGFRQHHRAESRGDAVVESCGAFSSIGGVKNLWQRCSIAAALEQISATDPFLHEHPSFN